MPLIGEQIMCHAAPAGRDQHGAGECGPQEAGRLQSHPEGGWIQRRAVGAGQGDSYN